MFLSYENHHRHSYYLKRNADLLGFDQMELAIMATRALFHRKTIPRRRHSEVAELDIHGQRSVRVLSVLLQLAESLDRSRSEVVSKARFQKTKAAAVILKLECHLELWGVHNHIEAFEKTFNKPLVIKTSPEIDMQ